MEKNKTSSLKKHKGVKTVLKTILIAFAVLIISVIGLFVVNSLKPVVPKNYTETVKAGGDIEATYLKNGAYAVDYTEVNVFENYKKYEIYYPEELTSADKKYPVIVVNNGTGVKGSKYKAVFEHLASWGFIVIGNEEEYSWNGFSADMSLNYLLKCNADSSSIFYQKIDTDNIGSVGHSQGGVGAINAVTDTKHSEMYKTVVAESPTYTELAHNLEWDFDIAKVDIPILMLAGTGDADANTVIPIDRMNEMYDAVDDSVIKVMARRKDTDHGDMLYSADGYVTAWFMWQLQGNENAGKAFSNGSGELLTNEIYQDQRSNLTK